MTPASDKIAEGLREALTVAKVDAENRDLRARIAELEAENARLKEALEPFSDAAEFIEDEWDDDEHVAEFPMRNGAVYCIFVSNFRAARAALTKEVG